MKRTYQPNNRRKSKKLGFMARMKTKMINRRRKKDVKFYLIKIPTDFSVDLFLLKVIVWKINILKNSRDFDRIIRNNKPYKYKDYIIYIERKTTDVYHFGISVGKKIGNAVIRNKIKRQIRSIISKNDYQNNFNCIIIVGRAITEKNYQEREENLLIALKNINIIKEK